MAYRARPTGANDDEVIFRLRGLLNDLQYWFTKLKNDVWRYAALPQRLCLCLKRFAQRLFVFRFLCDSQKRGFGCERCGEESAEIDCGLSGGCAVTANQNFHG